ncbi:MAG: AI-2E family transporter [Burkholderiaceae bacterium]
MEEDTAEPVRTSPVLSTSDPLPKFDARGTSLVLLAILAALFSLHLAAKFVIPVVISILIAYALDPLVSLCEKCHIPRLLGTLVVMSVVVVAVCTGLYALRGEAQAIVAQVPTVAHRLSRAVDGLSDNGPGLGDVKRAAKALEDASEHANAIAGSSANSHVVVVQPPPVTLRDLIMTGGMEAFAILGQSVMVIFLTFFVLLAGDKFKRKFVKVVGRTLSEKKLSVQMFDQINRSIQRYMLMLLITNSILGLVTWATFRAIGLDNAGTWALLAAVLHLVPYFGPLVIAVTTAMAGFLQYGTFGMAAFVGLASLGWAALIGTVITTWMTGRLARMNTVAVFLSLLLFSFIWGVWGALLSVPIAVIFKVVADHIEGMEALSEFLGD